MGLFSPLPRQLDSICQPCSACGPVDSVWRLSAPDLQAPSPSAEEKRPKIEHSFFFSNFLGAARISQQNPGTSRSKSLISLVSRDIPNFLAPTPSRGRPHQKISDQKVWLWALFSCLRILKLSKWEKNRTELEKESLFFASVWSTAFFYGNSLQFSDFLGFYCVDGQSFCNSRSQIADRSFCNLQIRFAMRIKFPLPTPFLSKDFCLEPGLEWKFLLRRTW